MSLPADPVEAESKTNAELREAAKRRMIDTAIRLIAEHGAAKLSLVDVGRESGYSHSLPNYYFKSKKRLLIEVFDHIITGFRARAQEWARTRNPVRVRPGLSNIEATIRAYVGLACTDPVRSRAMHLLWAESFSSMPELQPLARPFNERSVQFFSDQIRIGIERGEIRADVDPHGLGVTLLALLRGLVSQALIDPDAVDLVEAGEMAIRLLSHGIAVLPQAAVLNTDGPQD
jgi:AcrR family transcriptional regulator